VTAFRMLETREYGGLVPMLATEPESLDAVRIELLDTMRCWEEESLCASWTDDTPWWLWKCAHQPAADDQRRWCWGCDDPSDAERAELRRLADAAGGWWVWLDHPTESFRPAECPCDECEAERNWNHSGLRFVPLDVWRAAVALGDERAAKSMLAEHLASQVGT